MSMETQALSPGGGLGPAAAWVGQAGSAVRATGYLRRALLPAVELFRVFLSHHVEPVCNGSILKGKGTESRFLVTGAGEGGERERLLTGFSLGR